MRSSKETAPTGENETLEITTDSVSLDGAEILQPLLQLPSCAPHFSLQEEDERIRGKQNLTEEDEKDNLKSCCLA